MADFKPIPNPYIVGNPIKTRKMFYGRRDDFSFIKRKLEQGIKSYIIIFCGERRSGKTSILFQILHGELGEKFLPILIDMQTMAGLKNDGELFYKISREVVKSIPDFEVNLKNYDFSSTSQSAYKVFDHFLEHLQKSFPDKTVLFLIDEYEIIETKIAEGSLSSNFITYLAGVLESDKRISFIFTGSKNFEERDMDIWHVLFGKSLYRNVSFLSQRDTFRLIQEPVKAFVEYDAEVLQKIHRLTAGQPFYTQVVCQNIIDHLNEVQRYSVSSGDLEHIVDEILENPLPQMIYFWNSLSDDKKLILSLMADMLDSSEQMLTAKQIHKHVSKKEFGLTPGIKIVSTTLENLFHARILRKEDHTYNFQLDLFRRWIQRDHSIWQVIREVDIANLNRVEEGEEVDGLSQIVQKVPERSSFTRYMVASVSGVVGILLIFIFWQKWFPSPPSPPAVKTESATSQNLMEHTADSRQEMLAWEAKARKLKLNKDAGNFYQKGVLAKRKALKALEGKQYSVANEEFKRASNLFQKTIEIAAVSTKPTSLSENRIILYSQQAKQAKQQAKEIGAEGLPQFQKALQFEKIALQSEQQKKNARAIQNYQNAQKYYRLAYTTRKKSWENLLDSLIQIIAHQKRRLEEIPANQKNAEKFTAAQKKELEAEVFYKSSQYSKAAEAYRTSRNLYDTVLIAGKTALAKFKNQAQNLLTEIETLQKELPADIQFLPDYQEALISLNSGQSFLRNKEYQQAVENFTRTHQAMLKAQNLWQAHRQSIRNVIADYLKAIQNENSSDIQLLYPSIPERDLNGWIQFFGIADQIQVFNRFKQLRLTSNGALAHIDVKIEYDRNRGRGKWASWTIYLFQTPQGWRIQNIPKNQ